jgi:hypothetical protein
LSLEQHNKEDREQETHISKQNNNNLQCSIFLSSSFFYRQ